MSATAKFWDTLNEVIKTGNYRTIDSLLEQIASHQISGRGVTSGDMEFQAHILMARARLQELRDQENYDD